MKYYYLLKYFGLQWILFRVFYALKLKIGYFRIRSPLRLWAEIDFLDLLDESDLNEPERYIEIRRNSRVKFFFDQDQIDALKPLFEKWDGESTSPVAEADDIVKGTFRYFRYHKKEMGLPPNWFYDPFNNVSVDSTPHWSKIKDFGGTDIKIIWELSRFGFVYILVRAFARNQNADYVKTFWLLVEDWIAKNPPNQGPNWKCGQEISFRVMAWCFGLVAFIDHQESTPQRVAQLAKAIAISGQRIEANLAYAASQQNNHIISEAVGLFTIGTLFPEFKSAAKWQQTGKALLEKWGRELIYDDGAFAQHSLVYHRLMLHDYLWAIRVGRLNGIEFSDELINRIRQAGLFLYHLLDLSTGKAPYFGQNDGSLILPLDNGDYDDYRSSVQAVAVICDGKKWLPAGPWDELSEWLLGEQTKIELSHNPQTDLVAKTGGYYTLRSEQGFAFVKASEFQHRPAQADQLHVDIWWKGINIAKDAGTFAYHVPQPWDNPFASSHYHNTMCVDRIDQMYRVGKFLWLPWCKGFGDQTETRLIKLWQGSHDGYQRLDPGLIYKRTLVNIPQDVWIVLDTARTPQARRYRIHWLLNDFSYEQDMNKVILDTGYGDYYIHLYSGQNSKLDIIRADIKSPKGWQAHHYLVRQPALALTLEQTDKVAQFMTVFSPHPFELHEGDPVKIDLGSWQVQIAFTADNELDAIELFGAFKDRWAA